MTLLPASLVTGIDSPVTIGFVDGGAAFDDLAVDRNLVAGPHPQLIAHRHRVERYVLVAAIRLDPPRRLGGEFEQRADRTGRRLARPQFQHLAEQHQHGDDGGGLEIHRHRAVVAAERRRKRIRHKRRHDAVDVRDAGAHRDQREHVEIARDQRLPAAHEERRARPQHHGRGERELNPVRDVLGDEAMSSDQVRSHLQDEYRRGQRKADPETAGHIGEFGIGAGIGGGDLRLECHAADRAGAGADLADLRMHRAGVDRAGGNVVVPRRARPRYFSGSAANLVRQPAEQK